MNKEIIIIYGSCYGTTKKYAEELSGRLDCEAVSYENVRWCSGDEKDLKKAK